MKPAGTVRVIYNGQGKRRMSEHIYEAGVTVVKKITEFRWKCPKCGCEERYEPDDDDIAQLFSGVFSSQCRECEEVVSLFYEDEL